MMHTKVTIYQDIDKFEYDFDFNNSEQLTTKLYELSCKYNYYAAGIAVLVGDGYNGRGQMFAEDGTGTVDYYSGGPPFWLKNIDRLTVTISK